MQSLGIIHLSDIHLSKEKEGDTRVILSALLRDIKDQASQQGLVNPWVVLSGDLSQQGRPEEFDMAREFVGRIRDAVNPAGMVFCPGNHDLFWPDWRKSSANSELMENLCQKGINAEQALQRAETKFKEEGGRSILKAGMTNYHSFLQSKEINQIPDENYLYSVIPKQYEKFKVNFVAMNSAYLYAEKYYWHGYIGKPQIDEATIKAEEGLPDDCKLFNVAVFHHPFETIAPPSVVETENLVKDRFNIILNGHVHNLRVYMDLTSVPEPWRPRPIVSCARCVYDKEEDPTVLPGYSIINVTFDNNSVASLDVFLRRYDKSRRVWEKDRNLDYPVEALFSKAPKPELLKRREEMYLAGIRIANTQARQRLVVFQRTPSLILGSQPYWAGRDEKDPTEELFVSTFQSKITDCEQSKTFSVLYLYSAEDTKELLNQDLARNPLRHEIRDPKRLESAINELRRIARENIIELKKKESNSKIGPDFRFRLEPASFHIAGPLMVSESGYMMWVGSRSLTKDLTEILVLTSKHPAGAEEMIKELESKLVTRHHTADELLSQLGL